MNAPSSSSPMNAPDKATNNSINTVESLSSSTFVAPRIQGDSIWSLYVKCYEDRYVRRKWADRTPKALDPNLVPTTEWLASTLGKKEHETTDVKEKTSDAKEKVRKHQESSLFPPGDKEERGEALLKPLRKCEFHEDRSTASTAPTSHPSEGGPSDDEFSFMSFEQLQLTEVTQCDESITTNLDSMKTKWTSYLNSSSKGFRQKEEHLKGELQSIEEALWDHKTRIQRRETIGQQSRELRFRKGTIVPNCLDMTAQDDEDWFDHDAAANACLEDAT